MLLNFYIARHTFGTTITLLQGVPITSIKAMMGHDRIETTMNYAKANNSIVGADMMLVKEKMDQQNNLIDPIFLLSERMISMHSGF
jgi:hypothetical protein